jgi:hypothetical protein
MLTSAGSLPTGTPRRFARWDRFTTLLWFTGSSDIAPAAVSAPPAAQVADAAFIRS